MKIGAIVCEYNPLHNGHLYQVYKAKNEYGIDSMIGIMSGSFVQRGEPAILDKYTRARNAVENGLDLILELPTYFTLKSAEFFASGAIEIIKRLNIVDYLVFGSEIGSIETLKSIVNIINTSEYSTYLNEGMDLGLSYSSASNNAIIKAAKSKNIELPSINSNDILAIEYIKAAKNSNLVPITIKRKGADYLSLSTDDEFISATAIRNAIITKNDFKSVRDYVPGSVYELLESLNPANNVFAEELLFNLLLFTVFVEKRNLCTISRFEAGMDNLIINNLKTSSNLKELIDKLTSRRYTASRIKRFILNYLLNISSDMSFDYDNLYIRPLCFNEMGAKILSLLKDSSQLPLVSKFSDFYSECNNPLLELELRASNLYNLLHGIRIVNEDFLKSPIHLKSS
ncbi:nucleotidyltransferase [Microaceticoccus formicicus]|uniref:nucleotidyltransferase n=1 Tax=Microaceticoccus formicicus TaxID=3118105 RepID=UPI003CD03129|nr:nucleotidyltransferase [Peptoniphilaceae bacterium AMB_02]